VVARERQPALAIQAQADALPDQVRDSPLVMTCHTTPPGFRPRAETISSETPCSNPTVPLIGRLAAAAGIEARTVAGQRVPAHRHDGGVGLTQ